MIGQGDPAVTPPRQGRLAGRPAGRRGERQPRHQAAVSWSAARDRSPRSWGYIDGMPYYSSAQLLHGFIDRVSKNGNMMLNICPTADGTIPPEQKQILGAFGAFLKQFGSPTR